MTTESQDHDLLHSTFQCTATKDGLQEETFYALGVGRSYTAMAAQMAECIRIYRDAIDHYESLTPYKAYASIAEAMIRLGYSITESSVRSKVAGERPFTAEELGLFFKVCNYPQGFLRMNEVFCGIPWITRKRNDE